MIHLYEIPHSSYVWLKKKISIAIICGGRGYGGGITLYWQGFGFIVYALFKITTYAVYHL